MRILEALSWLEIERALEARALGSPGAAPRGASIDTRTLEPGDLFFALNTSAVNSLAVVLPAEPVMATKVAELLERTRRASSKRAFSGSSTIREKRPWSARLRSLITAHEAPFARADGT